MVLAEYVGARIRDLRTGYRSGEGLSQNELAQILQTTPNTISRWETGFYKPNIEDLARISQFFGVSVATFFPAAEFGEENNPQVVALLRATEGLQEDDLNELTEYARFRRGRTLLKHQHPGPSRDSSVTQ